MIRIANIDDINHGIKLLKEHSKEFDHYGKFEDSLDNYYQGLIKSMIQDKTAVVSIDDKGNINGTLLGMRIPNIVNPTYTQFHILFTWVHPDKRGSSIFYRMNKFLENNIIKNNEDSIYYSVEQTNLNHSKLGYRKLQTTYIKER